MEKGKKAFGMRKKRKEGSEEGREGKGKGEKGREVAEEGREGKSGGNAPQTKIYHYTAVQDHTRTCTQHE